MTRPGLISICLLISGLIFTPAGQAQESEAVVPPAPSGAGEDLVESEETNPGSQEVEYSEDNYRRFMELKDQNLEKSSMPTNAYQSGMQKLDELPEASQKHLRNQLREVILQEGKWAEGDEDKEYPYVPSEAAQGQPGLKKQEAEAWDELVGEYQQREAQIHANAARSDAAGAAAGAASGAASNTQAGSRGSGGKQGENAGQTGAGSQQGQAGQEQQNEDRSKQSGYSPSSSTNPNDPNAKSTAGVSENAMEFLTRQGMGGTKSSESNDASAEAGAGTSQNAMEFLAESANKGAGGSEGESGPQAGGSQAEGSQAEGSQAEAGGEMNDGARMQSAQDNANVQNPVVNTAVSQTSPDEADTPSTAGTSQNAMEFLMKKENQNSAEVTEPSKSAENTDSEKDLPELPVLGEPVSGELTVISKGTLSIKDLVNARGVTNSQESDSAPAPPEDTTEETKKDEDG